MPPLAPDLFQGTLDLLLLRVLAIQPMHGWAIAHHLSQVSQGRIEVPAGSLYPALHRLSRRGLLSARWGRTTDNRRVRLYALTAAGRRRLGEARTEFSEYASLVLRIMEAQ
jgi:transcriptional regulator